MGKLESYIKLESLETAKNYLVPHIFSENYYNILKAKMRGKKLSDNEKYYYNHFIKKKLKGMIELMEIGTLVNGREFIRRDRLNKAMALLNKYSRKHKGMKVIISGSFLYSENYNDIDVFVISKYEKDDHKEGKIHINYLSANIEKTLFFQSINAISISNFKSEGKIEEEFGIADMLHLYEIVILLIIQKDDCLQELRDLIVRLEYLPNKVILNSMQLKLITDKITKNKNPIAVINKYLIAKIINAYKRAVLRRTLNRFIKKNRSPEKGQRLYENWKIYNQTYKEVIGVVA